MHNLKINNYSFSTNNWEKDLNKEILNLLNAGIPVESVLLDDEILVNFHMNFGEKPYYRSEAEFRKTSFHNAINKSLYVILYQFYDDRGKWYMKKFNQLQEGLMMITEALK